MSLRNALLQDLDDKHLVDHLEASRFNWDMHNGGCNNIPRVEQQRLSPDKSIDKPPDDGSKDYIPYDLEKDVSVPVMLFENGKGMNIQFDTRNGENTEDDDELWGDFPNQKTTISKLFDENSPLHKDQDKGSIRYFHIPTNNMQWVEKAISLYFGDNPPDYNGTNRRLNGVEKTESYMMLREPYWRSQFHGHDRLRTPPHTRYMRPLCTTVSTCKLPITCLPDDGRTDNTKAVNKPDYNPKNMVLFMPYLHWETSRKREQFAVEIDSIVKQEVKNSDDLENKYKEKRQKERRDTARSPTAADSSKDCQGNTAKRTARQNERRQTPYENGRKLARKLVGKPMEDDKGRVNVRKPLGQYLLDAARLYEGMENYRDKLLLRKYIPLSPPFHPRRTLDQAFHWTLNSTRQRDRDQVIYRGTTALPEDIHSYDPEEEVWPKHEDFGIKGTCGECKASIQKVSRVIMVDQLWMWILDEKTLITCFPKRYGSNKHDQSAVHKSIRVRLQESPPGQIRSVFDLALIIVDECSNTFFDRTATIDRQPQVMDVFAKAIGNIMHRQTTAFERLWRWTETAGSIYRSRSAGDMSNLHVPLLDINPEGKIEREIKDIIEELDIMLHITKTHRDILEDFISNAENMLDPFGKYKVNLKHGMSSRSVWNQTQDSNGDKSSVETDGQKGSQNGQKQTQASNGNMTPEEKDRQKDYYWFKVNADERHRDVIKRIEGLEEMRGSAMSTADSVKSLLELKQQQASVVQAWQSVRQSEESIKQGRSIMMFTLVTIVFLPLSFLSSIFGMNNIEFSGDSWQIKDELKLMFAVSIGVISLSLLFAFCSWIRVGIWYGYNWLWTMFVIYTGIYDLWVDWGLPSETIHRNGLEFANRRKRDRREEKFKRRRDRQDKEEKSLENLEKQSDPMPTNFERASVDGSALGTGNGPFNISQPGTNGGSNYVSSLKGNGSSSMLSSGRSLVRPLRSRPHDQTDRIDIEAGKQNLG